MLRGLFATLLAVACVAGAGCFQLTGVSDYKVEEVCTVPIGQACRVAPNCGCSPTQTCHLISADGAGKCEDAGSVPSGGPCTTNAECSRKSACLESTCGEYCAKDTDCSGGASCNAVALGGTTVTSAGICALPCDPLNAAACRPGFACRISGNKTSCVKNPGSGGEGAPCANDLACAPTLFCDGTQCLQLCAVGSVCASGPCSAEAVSAQGVSYGVCAPGGGG